MTYPGLDPSLEEVVEELDATFDKKPYDGDPIEFRRTMADRAAELPLQRPPGLDVADHVFDTPFGTVPARIYRPEGTSAAAPAALYMHGGGWIMGDLNSHDAVCVDLAFETGAIVISLDYALAPEHPYPAALNQCHWIFHHVRGNADAWRLDPSSIAVAGDSAGANLSLALCLKSRKAGEPLPAAQLLVYPCLDLDFDSASYLKHATAPFLDRPTMIWIWKTYLAGNLETNDPLALPLREPDFAGLPPTVVHTAELDPLAQEGDRLAQRLIDAGVPVLHGRAKGLIHGFLRFRNQSKPSRQEFARMAAGLRMFLQP